MGAALTVEVGAPREPGSPRTLAQVVALVQEVMAAGAALGWAGVPTVDEASQWWQGLLADRDRTDAAVSAAYDGEELVGLGEWRRYQLPPQAVNADLEKVFVSAAARGSGVGALLVADLVEQARAAGIETLTLQCRGNNHGAIRLYQRLGFTEYGRLPDFVASGPDRWDKVMFAIDLRTGGEGLRRHGRAPVGEGSSP